MTEERRLPNLMLGANVIKLFSLAADDLEYKPECLSPVRYTCKHYARLSNGKHNCLFVQSISEKDRNLITVTPGVNVFKRFSFIGDAMKS